MVLSKRMITMILVGSVLNNLLCVSCCGETIHNIYGFGFYWLLKGRKGAIAAIHPWWGCMSTQFDRCHKRDDDRKAEAMKGLTEHKSEVKAHFDQTCSPTKGGEAVWKS